MFFDVKGSFVKIFKKRVNNWKRMSEKKIEENWEKRFPKGNTLWKRNYINNHYYQDCIEFKLRDNLRGNLNYSQGPCYEIFTPNIFLYTNPTDALKHFWTWLIYSQRYPYRNFIWKQELESFNGKGPGVESGYNTFIVLVQNCLLFWELCRWTS